MDHYHIWCNLKPGTSDLQFAEAVAGYLGGLKEQELIEGYTLTRRKLGFGPPGLGDFHIDILTRNMAQLEEAFQEVARRSDATESRHQGVYSLVQDLNFALYRDFPDPCRPRQ
jgi:hypothetical protein